MPYSFRFACIFPKYQISEHTEGERISYEQKKTTTLSNFLQITAICLLKSGFQSEIYLNRNFTIPSTYKQFIVFILLG